jgi:MoaA/NifB/PqqE/SkfB family radical SAM enzyme
MGNGGLHPLPEVEPDAAGNFLTFVVPASKGCNLKCPFCLVRQRREITETSLEPEDYARFVREAAEWAPIFAVGIQGYEPLLPESLPYTQAILATARFLGLPTTFVTNGVNLSEAIDLLKTLSPNKIAISLDAASAQIHDRIRGVAGSWVAAVAGIKRAIEALAPRTRLVVTSVLLPSRRHYLDAMPTCLREIGINRWIINPLVRVGADQAGGLVGDRARLFRDLFILQEASNRAGIRLTVDDEFGNLSRDVASFFQPELQALHVRALPPNVELFRLAPGGQCSAGADILRQVTPEAPRWQPGVVHAGDFLAGVADWRCPQVD